MLRRPEAAHLSGLYALTPDEVALPLLMELCDAAIAGGASAIQYRDKTASPSDFVVKAKALQALCRGRGVPLIVNDHLQVALDIGADGLHLGKDDGHVAKARAALGADRLLGVSCYADVARALEAQQQGASYIAFGSMFASPTKPQAPAAPLELFRIAKERGVTCPMVGIGGIDRGNISTLVKAGAQAAASIQGVFSPAQRDAVFANARALSLPFRL